MSPLYMNFTGYVGPGGQQLIPASETIKAATFVVETGHNIPDVFWNYLNSQGIVYENGNYVTGTITNWVSAFGYPITEPYWTSINVNGRSHPMLF